MSNHNRGFRFNYLCANGQDYAWGLVVTTIGCQRIAPYAQYPAPNEHPSIYEFTTDRGRVLQEYQIIYILDGGGVFESAHQKQIQVKSGDMILLFPGEWHNYHPDENKGWFEHWLGFEGGYIDQLVEDGFLSVEKPIISIGHSSLIKNLFETGASYSTSQPAGYQQLLSGIVQILLGYAFVQGKREKFKNQDQVDCINHAKQILAENFDTDIQMEDVAREVGLNYTTFRLVFREYTGFSPKSFVEDLRLRQAKALLCDTTLTSQEIAYKVGFNSPYYFSLFFKKKVGKTPLEYRKTTLLNE